MNYSSGLCLGVSHGAVDGDAVQAGCVNHPDQEWTEGDAFADGFYRIYNGYGQCLGVSAGETHDGADVVATACLGGHNDQLWRVEPNVSPQCDYPYFAPIFNDKATGKVIGVANGSTATSAPIVIFEFQGQCNNQYWGHTGS
ncbi:MAG TPA: RICIN domain-containing protein [Streptosporangiaceae bacterium]|nr:RICIN domain-containing protein [Streptosporangiaceae bacterium]